jgi:hypothetical protein
MDARQRVRFDLVGVKHLGHPVEVNHRFPVCGSVRHGLFLGN